MLATESSVSPASPPPERNRRGSWGRVRNRRVAIQGPSPLLIFAGWMAALGRRLLLVLQIVSKAALTLGVLAAVIWGGRLAARHVMASPRFAVREVQVTGGVRLGRDEVVERAGVSEGDRLLAIDTDAVAARVAAHPWVATVRVSRQLPSVLTIEITERHAAAVVNLGGLYLADERGRPFKRATMDEAAGLPVITGVARAQYGAQRDAVEAAFREALALLDEYRQGPGRPPISEVNVDPDFGFTLFLLEGGTEVRLGRGGFSKKLARLDQIFEAVQTGGAGGPGAVRVVHLDHQGGATSGRIPVRLAQREDRKKD